MANVMTSSGQQNAAAGNLGSLSAAERACRSVFVGNIPYEATEEALKDIFEQAGPVSTFRLVYDRETGKPKGYGFCEYQDIETAQSAMRNLNNYDFNGRPLRVGVAAGEQKDEMGSMRNALGGPVYESPYGESVDTEQAPEAISKAVASLPPEQMFELMKQMKLCIQNNPNEARNMLLQNPQLAYALLQAQIVMKIVDPQVALAMLHRDATQVPPLVSTESSTDKTAQQLPLNTSVQSSMPAQVQNPLDMSGIMAPQRMNPGQNMQRMMGMNPGQRGSMPQDMNNMNRPRGPMPNQGGPMGHMSMQSQPVSMPNQMGQMGGHGAMSQANQMGHQNQMGQQSQMGQPMGQYQQRAPEIRDPRIESLMQGTAGLAQLSSLTAGNIRSFAQGGPSGAISTQDQEKASLIMQVLQLTDQQIALLPPEQKHSILVLKDQIAKSV